jgi:hypothetical protein
MSSIALIPKQTIAVQIQIMIDEQQMNDLKTFIYRRSCLNKCNLFLIYFFHLVQSAGILTTTIATGYNEPYLIWVGVGLNVFASLLNIYEKNNANIIKKLKEEIDKIREGKTVEEPIIEDISEAHPATPPVPQFKLEGAIAPVLEAKKA